MSDNLFSLKPFIQAVWEKSAFETPTSIQSQAIPLITAGRDVIAESPTGTGKTLAYLLPVLDKINPDSQGIQAVILASSQELVMQILEQVQKWSEGSGIRSASFIGGANVARQLEKIKKRPQLIVGTPGRMLELIKQKKLKMHEVKMVVLDEGDQLLVPEHIETIRQIIKSSLGDRQVVLFSATLTERAVNIAKDLTQDAELIKVKKDETIKAGKVEHIYFVCENREKPMMLEKIGRLDNIRGLAFINDIVEINFVAEKLKFKDIQIAVLHSDLKKDDRKAALKNLRTGKIKLLIASDVAARGLDIQDVTHVVHVDFAKDITQYIHRSGRTGRFGADGIVISLVNEREERELKKYCHELNIPLSKKVFFGGNIIDEKDRPMKKEHEANKTKKPYSTIRNFSKTKK
ncbi:DEAD/DEAH box helicase [Pseudoneobacillus rhizosphaerae]|uniref:ATP-dependent RNA helicase YfmL n=1 Tax=Pseudoneobacillus rhizosphaerae TaxID=2880968 RepID=A0A9C7L9Q1_9BACI|nr:DEAD/DEAH box helicase [Pseudoneobacillus rhizosphaerae]CAG9607242.1 putative ATP-dependent RNA helicase YfmL [Pseudoneobacillus rhizosphaerae]